MQNGGDNGARKKLLVVKLSSLGDLFHPLPALAMIRAAWGASVDWVTQPEYVDLVRCFDGIGRVIAFPRRTFRAGLGGFLRELRREEYDLVLDFQGLLKSAFVARCARARRRIGPSYCREGSRLFYGEIAGRLDKERHAVEEGLDFVRHLGIPVGETVFPVSIPKVAVSEPRPRVAIVPFSRWPTKNWSASRFIEVGRALGARAGATLYMVGAPPDRAICDEIEKGVGGRVVNLCGRTSLVQLGGYLQEMDLVVTVDSGPMHMAAALGVPVLAVFGATDPKRTGPWGGAHRRITPVNLPCWPCCSDKCARGDIICLENPGVGSDKVIEAALEMLGAAHRKE